MNTETTRAEPAWLQAAVEQYRTRRMLDDGLIQAVCAMGRTADQLSPGERGYLAVHARRYRQTMAQLPDGEGRRLLDMGCFPGHLALLARVKGWRVQGVSLPGDTWGDPGFEARMHAAGIDIAAVDIQCQLFPFEDGAFDAAFFNETVEHLAFNPFQPLDELWRVLRPGSLLVFSVPNFSRFDLRWAALRGRSFHPPLESSLAEAFPSDIANRHIREYTPQEVRYLLEQQDKYLYQFRIDRLVMDRSWDGAFSQGDGAGRRIRPGALLRDFLSRVIPSLRGNIIVLARRPADYVGLKAGDLTGTGFLPEEDTGTGSGFVRLPIRAAWMGGAAELRLRVPAGRVRYVDVWAVLPAPGSVAPRRLSVQTPAGTQAFTVASSAEPRRLRIPADAVTNGAQPLVLKLQTDTWRPADHGLNDARALGVMLCLNRAAACVDPVHEPCYTKS